jgi:SH3-like domain-containing protein
MQRRSFLKVGVGSACAGTWFCGSAGAGALLSAAGPAQAQAVTRGPVTNLPMPRYVSLRSSEANARRGPSTSYRIDWVFMRRGMPLRVTGEYGNWRRVEDIEGLGGWMSHVMLSGNRTVIVTRDMAAIRLQADPRAPVVAFLEAGVIGRLLRSGEGWCRINADGLRGWIETASVWGVDPDESFG